LAKIWERAFDPDPSPDPVVRNFQDAIDKADILPEHLTDDEYALVLCTWIRHFAYFHTYSNIPGPSHHRHPL